MTLDDLAKAACEAEYPFPDDEWDEITDEETKRAWRRTALAVASAVLEAADKQLAANMEDYEAASAEAGDDTAVSDYEQLYMAAKEARDVLKEMFEELKQGDKT